MGRQKGSPGRGQPLGASWTSYGTKPVPGLWCGSGDEVVFVRVEGGEDGSVESLVRGRATSGQVGVLDRAEDMLDGFEPGRGRRRVNRRRSRASGSGRASRATRLCWPLALSSTVTSGRPAVVGWSSSPSEVRTRCSARKAPPEPTQGSGGRGYRCRARPEHAPDALRDSRRACVCTPRRAPTPRSPAGRGRSRTRPETSGGSLLPGRFLQLSQFRPRLGDAVGVQLVAQRAGVRAGAHPCPVAPWASGAWTA